MRVCPEIELIPVMHGKEVFAREVRRICSERKFDCIAVDIPSIFQDHIAEAVDDLPLVSALLAHEDDYMAGTGHASYIAGEHSSPLQCGFFEEPWFYLPVDPCDPMIEGIRQARQRRVPFFCVGDPVLRKNQKPLAPMPDEYSVKTIGFDAYSALCCAAVTEISLNISEMSDTKYINGKLDELRKRYRNILMIVHLRRFEALKNRISPTKSYSDRKNKRLGIRELADDEPVPEGCIDLGEALKLLRALAAEPKEPLEPWQDPDSRDHGPDPLEMLMAGMKSPPEPRLTPDPRDLDDDEYGERYRIIKRYINPDHLYFALGELPFVAAKTQMERQDPFAAPLDLTDAVKDLFRETRDNYSDGRDQVIKLSPVRIQAALTYLRNLTVMSGRLIPDLFDIVEAAKGVGGNSYALNILKSAKYYPFLPIDSGDESTVNVGMDRVSFADDMAAPGSEKEVYAAVNLFRDTEMFWRTINIKPDPSVLQKKKYRYSWNPFGHCSHLPEDTRIESFNAHARGKAMRVVAEHLARTEKFTTSVKDGIDIRETLRNWHTGSIYVKELPPAKNKVDTVIIIFDEGRDDNYPQRATWYAEHEEESTLSFYATGLFDDLIGPGIARCTYGGVALLFPPRTVPDIFETTGAMGVKGCAEQLVAGSLIHSKEKNVAYISAKPPPLRFRTMSSRMKKHLVWIPLSAFSNETLNRLRHFHVLNGRNVRSWASVFIGDGT